MSLATSLVSGAKPRTPKGSSRTAQGASPGFKGQIAESPERAAQGVRSQLQINARHKARLFGTGTNCIAPSGLPLLLCLFPGLAPWAFLSRPCGASFAPETSLASISTVPEVLTLRTGLHSNTEDSPVGALAIESTEFRNLVILYR